MDNIIEKFEIANIDKFIKYLSYNSFMKILLDKVKDSFILSFNNTNEEYNFKVETKPDPLALENLRTREFILSQKTIENLRGNLRYELLSGMEANESIDMITRRVSKIFVSNSVNIERICRTEVLHSLNSGRMEAYRSSKVVKYKMWISAKDKRTSALCNRMRGQIQEINSVFKDPKNPDDQWLHPPAHPNCRSTTIPLRKLPDDVIHTNGLIYAAGQVNKIEIPIDLLKSQYKSDNTELLNKNEREVWVKQTARRKGHWRTIKIKGDK
jgi:SPP1 gp7 family putative phage head morphogenesis protein